jgi:hypothetical protein
MKLRDRLRAATLSVAMLLLACGSLAYAQSAHQAETVTPRLKMAHDLYLKFRCIISSGKASEDVDAVLQAVEIAKDSPLYNTGRTVITAAVKLIGLQHGTPYCLFSKWSAEIGGRNVSTRTSMAQKQYAKKKLVRQRGLRPCGIGVCLQLVKGSPDIDGMTTCVETAGRGRIPTRSIVVGVGNVAGLVEEDQKALDKSCAARKY